jgi:flagellar motility protein MotE (MotC chaperone)
MSVELVKKEEELKARELQLKKKEEELQLLQDGLGKKIADFNKQQERLISCINVNKEEEDKRIKQVVEIISNMKPDAAAKLLNIQDETIAIKVLAFLPPVKVAKIFNLMDAEISAKLQKQYMTMLK